MSQNKSFFNVSKRIKPTLNMDLAFKKALPGVGNSLLEDRVRVEKYESLIRDAAEAFTVNLFAQAGKLYTQILDVMAEIKDPQIKSKKYLIKYMLCQTYIASGQYVDLIEAYQNLKLLDSEKFPAVLYALGQIHLRFFRFDFAKESIDKGLKCIQDNIKFQEECIPGTNFLINETTKEGFLECLEDLKEKCAGWHLPDAICSMKECQNYSQPYLTPCHNIFFADPAFNGMVIINCNNSSNSCEIKYHLSCWKAKKEEISPITKISDKNTLGFTCLTPNCEEDGKPCKISSVKVIAEDGTVKSLIESTAIHIQNSAKSVSKGAVRKQLPTVTNTKTPSKPVQKVMKRPLPNPLPQPPLAKELPRDEKEDWDYKIAKLVELRENKFANNPANSRRANVDMHDNGYMSQTADCLPDPDFQNNEFGETQNYAFSWFLTFITEKEGVRERGEILEQWETLQEMISASEASLILDDCVDIFEFLLQSPKFVQVGNYICLVENFLDAYEHLKLDKSSQMLKLQKIKVEKSEEISMDECDTMLDDFMNNTISASIMSSEEEIGYKKKSNVQGLPEIIDDADYYDDDDYDREDDLDYLLSSVDTDKTPANSNILRNNMSFYDEMDDDDYDSHEFLSNEEILRQQALQSQKPGNLLPKTNVAMIDHDKACSNVVPQVESCVEKPPVQAKMNPECGHNNIHMNGILEEKQAESRPDKLLKELKQNMKLKNVVEIDEYNYHDLKIIIAALLQEQAHMDEQLEKKNQEIVEKDKELKALKENSHTTENVSPLLTRFYQQYEEVKIDLMKKNEMMARFIEQKEETQKEFLQKLEEKEQIITVYDEEYNQLATTLQENQENMETLLESHTQEKRLLMTKVLELQSLANQNAIRSRIDLCTQVIDTLNMLNNEVKVLTNQPIALYHEWEQILGKLQQISADNTAQLAKLKTSILNQEEIDIESLHLPQAPALPEKTLGQIVSEAFSMFVKIQRNVLRGQQPPSLMPLPQMPVNPSPAYAGYFGTPFQSMPQVHMQQASILPPPLFRPGSFPPRMLSGVNLHYARQLPAPIMHGNFIPVQNGRDDTKISLKASEPHNNVDERSNSNSTLSNENVQVAITPEKIEEVDKVIKNHTVKSLDIVVQKMRQKYNGVPEIDLIESIIEVRKQNNNSLTGLEMSKILEIAESFIEKLQVKRVNSNYVNVIDKPSTFQHPGFIETGEYKYKNKVPKNLESEFYLVDRRLRNNSVSSTSSVGSLNRLEPETKPKKVLPSSSKTWEKLSNGNVEWKKEQPESECVICCESMTHHGTYTLKCNHTFHDKCLREWFRQSQSCPNCRVHSMLDDEFPPLK